MPEHKFLRLKGGFLSVNVTDIDNKPKISFTHHDVDGKKLMRLFFNFAYNSFVPLNDCIYNFSLVIISKGVYGFRLRNFFVN